MPPALLSRDEVVERIMNVVRRHGYDGASLAELSKETGLGRSSLYHYFPDGKEQLVNEAVGWAGRYAGNRVARFLAALPEPTPSGLFAEMVRQWTDEYETEGFDGGCPVAAATVDRARTADSTRQAAEAAFARWTGAVAGTLTDMGVPEERSRPLATLMISSLEGAILIARAERSVRALTTAARELGPLLDMAVTRPATDGGPGGTAGS